MKLLKVPSNVSDPNDVFYWQLVIGLCDERLVMADYIIVKTVVALLKLQQRILDEIADDELVFQVTNKHGAEVEGGGKANPLMTQLDRVNSQLLRHLTELGLSPKSRAKIIKTSKETADLEEPDEDEDI